MDVHCSRPHAGSNPGGVGCLRLSGLQSACEVQVSAQATGWIVRKGGAEEQDSATMNGRVVCPPVRAGFDSLRWTLQWRPKSRNPA